MRLKPVLFGLICALSMNAFAQQTETSVSAANWKENFGACLNDSTNFSKEIKEYSDIASLKATAQLQNVDLLTAGDYSRYVNAIIHLKPLTQDLKILRDLDKTGYFKSLFLDPRFQDFAGSSNFSILDLLKPDGDFLNPNVNKDPRIAKLLAQYHSADAASVFKATWDRIFARFASDSERVSIIQSLKDLSYFSDYYKVSVSIIDPTLSQSLIDYASYIEKNVTGPITENTVLKDIPFPQGLSRTNNRYANNYAELASVVVTTRIKFGLLVTKLSSENVDQFVAQNPKMTASLKATIKLKEPNFDGSNVQILAYLNKIQRPSSFAFDQFLVNREWGTNDTNPKKYQFQIGSNPIVDVDANQMAAIDGLARTLVGEAMSCQSAGSNQFEAIGLVFAERAKSIEDYYSMRQRSEDNEMDPTFFQKQKEIFYNSTTGDQFYRYLSNNLRGALDYGRKDTAGIKLHPISQALSAPLQFDSWQAVRSQKISLRTLKPQISKNIPEVNLDFYLPQSTQEANVFDTVLCPLKRVQNQGAFNTALDVAAQVVLNPDQYRKRFQFVDAKGSAFDEVYFYTHGVPLSFAIRIASTKLKDNQTGRTLPLIPPTTVGACGKVMFFKATPQNSYRIKN